MQKRTIKAPIPRRRRAYRLAALALAMQLRRLRESRGWTQRDAALRIGIGAAVLRRLESGAANPSLALLVSVARAFRVPLRRLLE
jgi:transcriptional regulator with XRE-family HTH domain